MTIEAHEDRAVAPLIAALPAQPDPDSLFEAFEAWALGENLTLYPAQTEALIEIVSGANAVVATPTGSGKSLIATGAHFAALAYGRRSYYTAPIKALVSEKFFALAELFGPSNVGMMTGDATVNPGAPIICATAEILANLALRAGPEADVDVVVMDEFHYYADPQRGWAWQVPLLELPQVQFVLMSATLGDTSQLEADLSERTGRATANITHTDRPVPLTYRWSLTPVHETLEELLTGGQAPIYVVHFTQLAAIERAQAMMSINVASREHKDAIAEALGDFRFSAGFGRTLSRLVRHGIGVHHAGMLPRYRRLVERLAQAGLLKVICGTDTLGVGINVPIRTVLLTGLSKYDGVKTRHLKAREFHQIAGRAGRAGYDTAGLVVVQAPEHVVENEKAVAKAGDDPKKRRKIVRKNPPEGFVSWGKPTFERLVAAEPEPLVSSFAITSAMLLQLAARPGDATEHVRRLLDATHESDEAKAAHLARAEELWDALLAADVVERLPSPDGEGHSVRVTVDLQRDFALNQPLSPFALAALELLDPESPGYALDVVSVLEATLEDPRQVLSAQRNRVRAEAVAQMKAEGIEYEERMELLEDVTYPKPLYEEILAGAYALYAEGQPWVTDYELHPKSVVREMSEQAMTFTDYVGFYQLARSEGSLLRYLSDAYRALRQTVPEDARTEDFSDLLEWVGEIVRQTDSSLLDEWEALSHPEAVLAGGPVEPAGPPPVTANVRAFRALVRNALFRRVRLAALRRWDQLGDLDAANGFDADAWQDALEAYFDEHDEIGTGPDARGPARLILDQQPDRWIVRQIFDDPAGDHDWGISAEIDLAASNEAGEAVVRVTAVDRM
jgi:superfamily II RNA helicase